MNWQPIETCPMDGKPMDVWSKEHGRCVDMVRIEHNGDKSNVYWSAVEAGYTCVRTPSHWMRVRPPNATGMTGKCVKCGKNVKLGTDGACTRR